MLERNEEIGEVDKEKLVKEFVSENPNPIMKVEGDGTVLYANRAAGALLEYWGINEGEKVPQALRHSIKRALSQENPTNLEFKVRKTAYSLIFHPLLEEDCVDIQGFDISLRVQDEEKLRRREKQYLSLSNLGRISIIYKDFQVVLEEGARIIAEGLNTQFSEILEILPDGNFIMRAGFGWEEGLAGNIIIKGKESYAGYTLLSREPVILRDLGTETHFKCTEFLGSHGVISGMTVLVGNKNEPFGVIGVYTKEKREFTAEDIHFLDSASFLLSETVKSFQAEKKLLTYQQEVEKLIEKRTLEYTETNEKLMQEIAERRKIEKKFQNNLQFLEVLLDSIPSPVFQRDLNKIYVNCNESFSRQIMGLPKEMVIGGSFQEFQKRIPKELVEMYQKHDRKLIERGGSHYYETKVVCADGVQRDFLVHKATYHNSSGEVAGVIGVMLDITKHKAAERASWKNEERYRIVAEQTGQLVYDYDTESGSIDWAGAILQTTGYSPGEFKKADLEGWKANIHEEDRKRAWESHERCMKTGGKYCEEYRFRKKDGTYFHAEDSGVYLLDEGGRISRIVGAIKDITERKLAQEKLEKSEEKYRIAAEQTGQIVFDYDVRTEKVDWAGAISELTGYSYEEFQKVTPEIWTEQIHPQDRKKVIERISLFFESGDRLREEFRFRRKDGNYIHVEDRGALLRDEKGSAYRLLGVMKDITKLKLAQESLEKSEEKYRIAAEQTGQIVFDYNRVTGKVQWAGAIKELTQYSLEEFQSFSKKDWASHIHPDDRKRVIEKLKECEGEGERFNVEYRFRRRDGSFFYVEDRGIFLKDDQGRFYRDIGVMKDITGIKLASERLKESEQRYRSFMRNFRGIAFQMGLNLAPILVDGSVEEISGYKADDLIYGKIDWYQIVFPEDRKRLFENRDKLISDPLLLIEHEYRIKHRDGKVRWVREIIQNVSDATGTKRILQGAIYDITGQKEAEESLKKVEEIRKKEIHHRIKNNLQVISSLLELQAEKFNEKEVLEAFRESQNRVATMAIIHEELYRSRNNETLDFSAYLQKLITDLFRSYTVREGDVRMQLDLEETFLGMDTAVPLGIIINELVSNSLKHAFPPGRKGEIRIILCKTEESMNKNISNITYNIGSKSSVDRSNQYKLVVSDNGLGFPETIDFRNTSSLGLQLVNILVEQLEGVIELEKSSGTAFKILFKENS